MPVAETRSLCARRTSSNPDPVVNVLPRTFAVLANAALRPRELSNDPHGRPASATREQAQTPNTSVEGRASSSASASASGASGSSCWPRHPGRPRSGGLAGSPRWRRMRCATDSSSSMASMRMGPPQRGQTSASIPKVRAKSRAQSRRRARSGSSGRAGELDATGSAAGDRATTFPRGTYAMRVRFGVFCASDGRGLRGFSLPTDLYWRRRNALHRPPRCSDLPGKHPTLLHRPDRASLSQVGLEEHDVRSVEFPPESRLLPSTFFATRRFIPSMTYSTTRPSGRSTRRRFPTSSWELDRMMVLRSLQSLDVSSDHLITSRSMAHVFLRCEHEL